MNHEIIRTEDYLLVVNGGSDGVFTNGTYVYHEGGKIIKWIFGNTFYLGDLCRKILAHRPINDAPILEGVPTYVEWLAKQTTIKYVNEREKQTAYLEFVNGYQSAKKEKSDELLSKYQEGMAKGLELSKELFTEEDIANSKRNGIEYACNILEGLLETGVNPKYNLSDLLRLKTNLIDKSQVRENENIQPTWDDVRKAIDLSKYNLPTLSVTQIIEQLKQSKA